MDLKLRANAGLALALTAIAVATHAIVTSIDTTDSLAGLVRVLDGLEAAALTGAVISAYFAHARGELSLRPALVMIGLCLLVAGYDAAKVLWYDLMVPHTWDFVPFYAYARLAALGLDFYSPADYHAAVASGQLAIAVDEDVSRYVLDMGMFYPPTTIIYFLPFGYFETDAARWLWHAFTAAPLVVVVALFAERVLTAGPRLLRYAAAGALMLALPGTYWVFYNAQTGLFLLALTLACLLARGQLRQGFWAGVAMTVKPILAIAGAFFVLRRNWRAAFTAAGVVVALTLLAWLLVGSQPFVTYLFNNPIADNAPLAGFQFPNNQSLLAIVLRNFDFGFSASVAPVFHPVFLLLAAVIAALTAYAIWTAKETERDLAFALALAGALMLYPGTLTHYGVLLSVPLFLLLRCALEGRVSPWLAFSLPIAVAALSKHSLFTASLLTWLSVFVVLVRAPRYAVTMSPAARSAS